MGYCGTWLETLCLPPRGGARRARGSRLPSLGFLPSEAGVGRLCMLVSDECVHVHECALFLRKALGAARPPVPEQQCEAGC